MVNVKNGRMFSAEFNKATEVNSQTRLLAQTPNEPVEYMDLEQVADVVNEGMLSDQEAAKTYATKTGEYKELTAGFAYEILGDSQATPEKFSFRPTGGPNRNVRDGSARIEVLKGNSVVQNQLVPNSDFRNGVSGWRYYALSDAEANTTVENNTLTLISNVDKEYWGLRTPEMSTINVGHKMLIESIFLVSVDGQSTIRVIPTFTNNSEYSAENVPTNEWLYRTRIAEVTKEISPEIGVRVVPTSKGTLKCKLLKVTDLTQMFGADIANNITKPEQFYELLPEGIDINAYNAGEIVDANYKAIKTTGFNQYNGTYAKVLGGVKYYLGGSYTSIGYTTEEGGTTEAITISSDKFYTPSQNGYIYAQGADICINIAWDEYSALNGTYKPYKPFERDLSWVAKYFPNGMRSAGNVADEIRFNSTTQQWEAVQNVGVRAYQSGDEADTAVTTDGKNTNYALATPDVKTVTEDVNLAYDIADYGTEQLIVAEGAQSAPLSAEVVYEPNVLASIKQVAAMLTRLDALETAVATMQASAVATTNEE